MTTDIVSRVCQASAKLDEAARLIIEAQVSLGDMARHGAGGFTPPQLKTYKQLEATASRVLDLRAGVDQLVRATAALMPAEDDLT